MLCVIAGMECMYTNSYQSLTGFDSVITQLPGYVESFCRYEPLLIRHPYTFLIDDFSVEFMFTCPSFFVLFFFPNVLCNVYIHTQLLLFIKEFVSYDSKLFSV